MTMKNGKLVKSKTDVITNSSTEVFVLARNKGDNRTCSVTQLYLSITESQFANIT